MSDTEKINKLLVLVENLTKEVASLKEIVLSRNMSISTEQTNIKPLIEEDYLKILDKKEVKRYMQMKAPGSELKLFKRIYGNEGTVPLKINKKKVICYYDGEKWIDDETGDNYIKIYLNNVSRMYTKENKLDNCKGDPQKFIDNQNHITSLRDEKIIKKLMSQIVKEYK